MWRRLSLVALLLVGSALGTPGCDGQSEESCGVDGDAAGLMQVRSAGGRVALPDYLDQLVDGLMVEIEKALPKGPAKAAGAGELWNDILKSIRNLLVNGLSPLMVCADNQTVAANSTIDFVNAGIQFLLTCKYTDWAKDQIHKQVATWGDEVRITPHAPKENFSKPNATIGWLYATATTCPMEQLERWPDGFDNFQCKYLAMDGSEAHAAPYQDQQDDFSKIIDIISKKVAALVAKCLPKVGKTIPEAVVKIFLNYVVLKYREQVEALFQGNKKGFVAVDKVLGAVVVSVSGTGIPGDPGVLDDFFADGNFFWNIAGEKTAECIVAGTRLPGYYHPGFCLYYQKMLLYSDYEELLKKAVQENPDVDLFFTGHSLGGAAITIAAIDAQYRLGLKPKRWLLYTYGSPTAGSPDSANYVNTHFDAAWRITRKYDPVPLMVPCYPANGIDGWSEVPPGQSACTPLEKGPYHYGAEVYFPYDPYDPKPGFPPQVPEYQECNGYGEDPACSSSVPLKEFLCKANALPGGVDIDWSNIDWKEVLKLLAAVIEVDPTKLVQGFGMIHVDYMDNGLSEWCCAAM